MSTTVCRAPPCPSSALRTNDAAQHTHPRRYRPPLRASAAPPSPARYTLSRCVQRRVERALSGCPSRPAPHTQVPGGGAPRSRSPAIVAGDVYDPDTRPTHTVCQQRMQAPARRASNVFPSGPPEPEPAVAHDAQRTQRRPRIRGRFACAAPSRDVVPAAAPRRPAGVSRRGHGFKRPDARRSPLSTALPASHAQVLALTLPPHVPARPAPRLSALSPHARQRSRVSRRPKDLETRARALSSPPPQTSRPTRALPPPPTETATCHHSASALVDSLHSQNSSRFTLPYSLFSEAHPPFPLFCFCFCFCFSLTLESGWLLVSFLHRPAVPFAYGLGRRRLPSPATRLSPLAFAAAS
ncbi:hypothetical protein B0H15DRAFT_1023974 [Mycena belliarum]|uniref:Uncharacterized protein n=1 Tax=Mycena belliarum TaxID=1033014 RepID=A0AAD6XPH6_9AGAR|nr:hypothetical protein B0H15DRAFT_1023974 [Mycena belliae]